MVESPVFQLLRPRGCSGFSWDGENFHPIRVGKEGEKGSIRLAHGKHIVDGVFIKYVGSLEQAQEQYEKYLSLKARGISTFQIVKIAVEYKDGEPSYYILSNDRSLGGKRWVVSANNRAIVNTPEFYDVIQSMSQEAKQRLIRQVFDIAIQASLPNESRERLILYTPTSRMNPFMLDINPEQPDDVHALIGDVGIDVISTYDFEHYFSPDTIITYNLIAACSFLYDLTGYTDGIPEDHIASWWSHSLSLKQLQMDHDLDSWYQQTHPGPLRNSTMSPIPCEWVEDSGRFTPDTYDLID